MKPALPTIQDDATPNQRMLLLDILRLIAALAVWLFHCCYLDPVFHSAPWEVNPALQTAASYGYLGVPIFFMISGFVIAASGRGRTLSAFARARLARLYPAFIISLVPTLLAIYLTNQPVTLKQVSANLTMVPLFFKQAYLDPVYWSLMFEIIFYGFIGLFVISKNFSHRLRAFSVVWLAVATVNLFTPLPMKAALVLDWAPYFCIGIFAWLMSCEARRIDRSLWISSVAVSAVTAALHARANPLVAAFIVLAAGLSFPALTRARIPPQFARSAMVAGAISYPLYLIHDVFGGWLARSTQNYAISALLILSISYLITRAEKPISRWISGRSRSTASDSSRLTNREGEA